jgi:hypothetical protein
MTVPGAFPGLLLLSWLGFLACEFSPPGEEAVEIAIPTLPEAWKGLEGMELALSFRDSSGRWRELPVLAGETRSLALSSSRACAIIVEARNRGRALKPAGVIYPSGTRPRQTAFPVSVTRLEPSWRGGWTASVFRLLDEAGLPTGYDFDRLEKEAAARLGDPWAIEPRTVARSLAEGSFRLDRLKAPDPLPVILPGPGPWVPASPFASPPVAIEGGYRAELVPGLRQFFSNDLELFVACGAETETVVLVLPLPALGQAARRPPHVSVP